MTSKLTLRLDENLIKSAKKYSAKSGKSVSRIVADLFAIINNEKLGKKIRLSPMTRSLKGAMKDQTVTIQDYKKHLEENHL